MIKHIIYIIGTSLIATIFLLPISALDSYFISTFHRYSFWVTIPVMVVADMFSAFLVYKLSYLFIPLVIKKETTKQKLEAVGEKLKRWGFWGLVLAASTPLPYSLFIYCAGIIRWGTSRDFMLAILIGRTVKYIIITIAILLGISIFLP